MVDSSTATDGASHTQSGAGYPDNFIVAFPKTRISCVVFKHGQLFKGGLAGLAPADTFWMAAIGRIKPVEEMFFIKKSGGFTSGIPLYDMLKEFQKHKKLKNQIKLKTTKHNDNK